MTSVKAIEVLTDHGAMKTNQASHPIEVCRKRVYVTVAEQDFRISSDQIEIQVRQEVVGSISATRADDRLDVRRAKHLIQFMDTTPHSTGPLGATRPGTWRGARRSAVRSRTA